MGRKMDMPAVAGHQGALSEYTIHQQLTMALCVSESKGLDRDNSKLQ